MDVRVSAYGGGSYRPVVVSSFGRSGSVPASVSVTASGQNGPVPAVNRVGSAANALNTPRAEQAPSVNPAAARTAYAPDEQRGTRVDIMV